MKKILLGFLGILLLAVLVLILLPSNIEPVSFLPAQAPALIGDFEPNQALQKAELVGLGKIQGPEEVAVDSFGNVYGGTMDGKILRILPSGEVEEFANTLGRPLGMQFDSANNLIVCDAYKGLLSINVKGEITLLATSAKDKAFKFTDALDIASDGMIYFTDASDVHEQTEYLLDLLAAKPHGRFMQYNPKTKEIKVLLDQLYFANGVALSQQEDFVLINETYRYRIRRYWLKGPKAGTSDIFIDNLPGFPDNISSNGKGDFWLALFTVRNPTMDKLHPYPFLKKQLSKLPKAVWPKPEPYGFVLQLDENAQVVRSLQDPTGQHLKEITSAKEHKGYLYLGSLHNDRVGKFSLK